MPSPGRVRRAGIAWTRVDLHGLAGVRNNTTRTMFALNEICMLTMGDTWKPCVTATAPAEAVIEESRHRDRFKGGWDEEGCLEELRHRLRYQRMLKHRQVEVETEAAWFGRMLGDAGRIGGFPVHRVRRTPG